jgi:hypothetical protein
MASGKPLRGSAVIGFAPPSTKFEQFRVIAGNRNPQCWGMDWWRLQKRRLIDTDSGRALIPMLMVYYEKRFESALCCCV